MAKQGSMLAAVPRINVLENAVLVSLRFSNLGNTGRVDAAKVQTNADKKSLRVSKMLLDSEEYRAIMNHRARWREWLEERSAPSALGGTATHALSLALLPEVEQENVRREALDAELVEALVAVYPERVREARDRLKEEFRFGDYLNPEEVRAAFDVRLSYLSIGTPDILKKVSRSLHAREVEKFYAALDDTANKIDRTLTGELAELVGWMVDRLADRDDGKAKTFGKPFDDRLTKMQEFFRLLKHRNLTGNDELDALADQAKVLLSGITAETIKSDGDFRKRVVDQFSGVKAKLDEMVTAKPTRRIVIED